MDPAKRRVQILQRHLQSFSLSEENCLSIENKASVFYPLNLEWRAVSSTQDSHSVSKASYSSVPYKRQEVLKWNGWGYHDSKFIVHKDKDFSVSFTGDRYKIGENLILPHFATWVIETLGVDFNHGIPPNELPSLEDYPSPIIHKEFVESIKSLHLKISTDGEDRLFRAHGHTLSEIFTLREGMFPRIPDIVIWPENHGEVENIVALAEKYHIVIIPFGGGTSVSGALLCPEYEFRMIASLDTSQMNKILWINETNMTAGIEAGIIGQNLERELQFKGFTTGHEPDSYEFSSLGGWIATRASGMKKNIYGNIEDLVVHVKMVTPKGTVEKFATGPRMSAGPDIYHFILGSEGTLGVVTEATLKIRPIPPVKRYGSLVFPDFNNGIAFMREVALHRCQPASIRLMDNEQFKFGHALKPPSSYMGLLSEGIKKIYITRLKGFDVSKMCVVTLLFEGNSSEVIMQEKSINEICLHHGGLPAGEANGERGYMLTFVIAYIRDLAFDYGVVAESFETSVPWDKVEALCHNVKHRIKTKCKEKGIQHSFVTCRVTQTYDAGACVYFYFAFNYRGINLSDPVHVYEEIENAARDEVIGCGGSISHHHGIGKIRKKWMSQTMSSAGLDAIKALKHHFDPSNIFANGNLV